VDPWTGEDVAVTEVQAANGTASMELAPTFALLRRGRLEFPAVTRLDRGQDLAFHLVLSP